ncbi:hypothetical protein ACFX2K_041056 [Malus domestica]
MESHPNTCYLRVEDEPETNSLTKKWRDRRRNYIRRNAAVEVVCGDVHPSELRVPPQAPGKTEESKVFQLRKGFWDPPRNQIVGKIQALESSDVAELRRN